MQITGDPASPRIPHDQAITIVATHTRDLVPNGHGGTLETAGGPATYISRALDLLQWPHAVITGESPTVTVVQTDHGEQYVIPPIPVIELPNVLRAAAVILSPIVREIDPLLIPPIEGLLVIDVQGFVREPNKPQEAVTEQFDLHRLFHRSDVVKASVDELNRLTPGSRTALQDRILVVTHGRSGATIFDHGVPHRIESHPVDAPNTIGAGDNFLAAFTVSMIRGASPREAGTAAARFTEEWLRQRG